jgi:hypothetical protein
VGIIAGGDFLGFILKNVISKCAIFSMVTELWMYVHMHACMYVYNATYLLTSKSVVISELNGISVEKWQREWDQTMG